jgi:hypothetical protein
MELEKERDRHREVELKTKNIARERELPGKLIAIF